MLRADKTPRLTLAGAQFLLARVTYPVDTPKVMTHCRNSHANADVNVDEIFALMLVALNFAGET